MMKRSKQVLFWLLAAVLILPLSFAAVPAAVAEGDGPQVGGGVALTPAGYPPLGGKQYLAKGRFTWYATTGEKLVQFNEMYLEFLCQDGGNLEVAFSFPPAGSALPEDVAAALSAEGLQGAASSPSEVAPGNGGCPSANGWVGLRMQNDKLKYKNKPRLWMLGGASVIHAYVKLDSTTGEAKSIKGTIHSCLYWMGNPLSVLEGKFTARPI